MLPGEVRQLKELIDDAAAMVYEKDRLLILQGAREETLVFRFGLYLNQLMQEREMYFDCEVDMDCQPRADHGGKISAEVYPNLVLHKRGTNQHNLLALMFRGFWHSKSLKTDEAVLLELTELLRPGHFMLGASILFGQEQAEMHYFSKGRRISASEPVAWEKNHAEEDLL